MSASRVFLSPSYATKGIELAKKFGFSSLKNWIDAIIDGRLICEEVKEHEKLVSRVRILEEENKELKISKDQLLATKDEEIRRITGIRLRLKINFNFCRCFFQ